MKIEETSNPTLMPVTETQKAWEGVVPKWETGLVYRELEEVPVQIVDPLEHMQSQLAKLEELQARVRFMMKEIRNQIKL